MKKRFIPLVIAVSLIFVSSFFVFAHVVVITQLDREHHPELLPNHPFLLVPHSYAIGAPPPERVPVSILRVIDSNGNHVDLVNKGEQIQIQADLTNAQDRVQSLAYIVEVYEEDDNQVFRGWIDATLEPMTSFSPAVSWIPEKPGHYIAKMMVWESLDNPSSLSPGLETEFTVVGNMDALNENRRCGEEKELVFKINFKKAACVIPDTLVKLLGRGWADWHDWYSPLLIENLRQGPQDVDEVHSEFVKREIMKDSKVADYFLLAKKFDFTCCSYQYKEGDDRNPRYQLVVNISDLADDKQLVVVYDLSQTKVTETKLKNLVHLGGPITPNLEPDGKIIEFTKEFPEFPKTDSLRPEDRLQVRHSAGYTTIEITLSSWEEYNEWEKSRGPEHDAMPPISIGIDTINPIVFDLLFEMWNFTDYEVSLYDNNLFRKTIHKDYSVPNHHGIYDWLESEFNKQYGEKKDGSFSNHFEFRDKVYSVTMSAAD